MRRLNEQKFFGSFFQKRTAFSLSPTQQKAQSALTRTAQRYETAGPFARRYIAGKLRHDPVAPALLALAAQQHFGAIADVGCGRGQFGVALLEAGDAHSVLALDIKAEHLAEARTAAFGLPFETRLQDLSINQDVPAADTVLLIDVLYQLGSATQTTLLNNAARAARRLIIVRSADPARGLRSLTTRALEVTFRRVWPHAGAHVNARPLGEIQSVLQESGFACRLLPCWAGTPFSNMLLVAGRRTEKERSGLCPEPR